VALTLGILQSSWKIVNGIYIVPFHLPDTFMCLSMLSQMRELNSANNSKHLGDNPEPQIETMTAAI
jgi:hypothetical protein